MVNDPERYSKQPVNSSDCCIHLQLSVVLLFEYWNAADLNGHWTRLVRLRRGSTSDLLFH